MNPGQLDSTPPPSPPAESGAEPTWDVALLFPAQGSWSEEEYLGLTGNRLVEYSHGYLEVLPMPTTSHQRIVACLYGLLLQFVSAGRLGTVLFAPLRVRLWPGKYREPDILFMLAQNQAKMREEFWEGADLVVEVVSNEDRRRDIETKRREYAQAAIREYWIVDPLEQQISVLRLEGDRYIVHGAHHPGQMASSALLPGLAVEVAAVLGAAH